MKYHGEPGGQVRGMALIFRLVLICMAMVGTSAGPLSVVAAQAQRTSTPIVVSLVTPTPPGAAEFAPTVTVSPTATLPGPAVLQARESAGRVNVRAAPDTSSELLGTISFGTQYPLLRRYYLWYELGYELSPNKRAWVFSELVDVDGNLDAVPAITDFADIAITFGDGNNVESDAVSAAGLTAAEDDSRILVIDVTSEPNRERDAPAANTALPTFTYPADIPTFSPALPEPEMESEEADGVIDTFSNLPPLFPVVLLAGFGIVGILISFIRR